jgi:hypothetical protein
MAFLSHSMELLDWSEAVFIGCAYAHVRFWASAIEAEDRLVLVMNDGDEAFGCMGGKLDTSISIIMNVLMRTFGPIRTCCT